MTAGSVSGKLLFNFSITSFLTVETATSREILSWLKSRRIPRNRFSLINLRAENSSSEPTVGATNSLFGFPISFRRASMPFTMLWHSFTPILMAFKKSCWYTFSADASSMTTKFGKEELTTKFRRLFVSSLRVGFMTTSLSISPTRTAATGPFQGISETARAAEAALMLSTSGSLTPSTESKLQTTWVS